MSSPSKLIVVVPAILLTRGGAKVSLTLKGTSESEAGLTDLSIELVMLDSVEFIFLSFSLLFQSALFFRSRGGRVKNRDGKI